MTSAERLEDLKRVSDAIAEARRVFLEYLLAHNVYRQAVKEGAGLKLLMELHQGFKRERYAARKAWFHMKGTVEAVTAKYADDALGEVLESIKTQIVSWDLNTLKSKYAAKWFEAFEARLAMLMVPKFNSGKGRPSQTKKIAKEPWPMDLPTPFDIPVNKSAPYPEEGVGGSE
jgi:hypothetical protein